MTGLRLPGFDVAAVVERVCGALPAFGSAMEARADLRSRRRGGQASWWSYRCPFAEEPHWHVSEQPTLTEIEDIARAVRER